MKKNGFVAIGHKALSIETLGRSQIAFILSAMGSKNQSNEITKKRLCERAKLKGNHYSRYLESLEKHKEILGDYQYDLDRKKVTSTYKLYRNGEQFIKVPQYVISNKLISKHDMIVLLVLSLFTHKEKNAWRSNVSHLVKEGNHMLEKKGYAPRLDLTTTYESIKRLSILNLLEFQKTSRVIKGKNSKYFFNYISDIKLTDKYWNIGITKEDIYLSLGETTKVASKVQEQVLKHMDNVTEDNDLSWDDIDKAFNGSF